MSATRRLGAPALALALALGPTTPAAVAVPDGPYGGSRTAVAQAAAARPAVVESRLLGRSVDGRSIWAWRLGERSAAGKPRRTVVLLAVMHGTERAARTILRTLRDGPRIAGVDLWVVPVVNPDGAAAHRRGNARGVDLNRNFPHRWKAQPQRYNAGAKPASEPETRAVMRFLDDVDPDLVLSFHQPLHAVDTTLVKRPALARAVAEGLKLPLRRVDCNGTCHGTLTGWFNARHDGMALTVELGRRPTDAYLTRAAPRGLLAAIGGRTRS